MTDLSAVAEAARCHPNRPIVAVDNTFMGPAFQHPLSHQADLVVYSATKFLSGSSDMIAGVILGRDSELIAGLCGTRAILGNILQPDECWLLNGRLTTVLLRMNRQSKNAERIAEGLVGHPKTGLMHYPKYFEDPDQIRIRDAQCRFPGSLIAFELHGGKPAAFDFPRRVQIARNAVSPVGVESLVCHPATTTHSEMNEEDRRVAGFSEGLVRISVGVEDPRDLLRDFRQALDGV